MRIGGLTKEEVNDACFAGMVGSGGISGSRMGGMIRNCFCK